MTIHGDLYYEGKEFETRLKNKKPGDLSDELRVALGMPTGLVCKSLHSYMWANVFLIEQTFVSTTVAYCHAKIWSPSVISKSQNTRS